MAMRNLTIMLLLLAAPSFAAAAPADHGLPPGPGPDVTGGPGGKGPGPGCVEDAYEPDAQTDPQELSPGHFADMAVCNGNDDYWRIDVTPGMAIDVEISFPHSVGDVDMSLHRPGSFEMIALSEGVTDNEHITFTATQSETLVLYIYGYEGISNTYQLDLSVTDFSAGCGGDGFEGNDSMSDARTVPPGEHDADICIRDEDWYVVDLAPGEGFDFGVNIDENMSPLSLGLYAETSGLAPLEVRRLAGTQGQITLAEAPVGGRYFVRVFADDDGYNRYSFSLARYAPGRIERGSVVGRVQYEDRLRGRDLVIGGAATGWSAVRDVPVELVRAVDGRVLATAYTDETGAYELSYVHRASGDLHVRVAPRLEGPGYRMQVVPHDRSGLYEERSAALSRLPTDGAARRADFRFPADGPLGGAFNVADRSLDAFRFVSEFTAPTDLNLTVVWERGLPHACTSCYENSTIHLGGGFDDPDEYDDSVILHEFGHFFIDQMSHDDSPGGHHSGERTDPLVAYGEGIATAFALMVEGYPIYIDTMASGGINQNFETAAYPEARGTTTGNVHGQVSEYLVVAVIWDLFDSVAEPHDQLSAGGSAVMRVLTEYMPTCTERNRGVAGAELADFVQGFRSLYPEHNPELDRILARHDFPAGVQGHARPSGVK